MKKFAVVLLALLLTISYSTLSVQAALDTDEVDDIIASIPEEWPDAPEVAAEAAILIDAESGEILYGKNATKKMYPASTTKLMTALLTLENASLRDTVTFSQTAVAIPSGSSHIGMRRNEKMILEECLYGLLLPSANEVANALAEHVGKSINSFVKMMNERVYRLGGVNTSFSNANGLHSPGHYTCAYDMALIMKACAENSTFVEIASTPSYVHHADELLNKNIPMTNTHMMIRRSSGYYNEYVVCGKTGHTAESGYNLVTYAEKNGTKLIVVVMGCENGGQYVSTQSLLDYGFNYFHRVLPAELDTALNMENMFTASKLEIPTPEVSLLQLNASETILLPDTLTFDMLEKTVEDTDDGKQVTYTYKNYPLGSVSLSYVSDSESAPFLKDKAAELPGPNLPENLNTIDGWLIVVLAALIAALVFLLIGLKRRFMPTGRKFL